MTDTIDSLQSDLKTVEEAKQNMALAIQAIKETYTLTEALEEDLDQIINYHIWTLITGKSEPDEND